MKYTQTQHSGRDVGLGGLMVLVLMLFLKTGEVVLGKHPQCFFPCPCYLKECTVLVHV